MSEFARRTTGTFTAVGGRSTGRGVTKNRTMSGPEFRKYLLDKMKRAELRAELAKTKAEKKKYLIEAIRTGKMILRMDDLWPTGESYRSETPEHR